MKLRSLKIGRLAGIQPGFELDQLSPGINVITGPNASGKSSFLRALRASLYPDALRDTNVHLEATFSYENEELHSTRIGQNIHWTRDGQPVNVPLLPEYRFLSCYTLAIEDLLGHHENTDDAIGDSLARDLAGGYDISSVRASTPFSIKSNHGRPAANELANAQDALRKKQHEHQVLRQEEVKLKELRADKDRAEEAEDQVEAHQRALVLLEARRRRRALETELGEFPEGMDKLQGNERTRLNDLQNERRQHESEREQQKANYAAAEKLLAESGLTESALDEAIVNDRRQQVQRLKELESTAEHHRSQLAEATVGLKESIQDLGGEPDKTVKVDHKTLARVESELTLKRELEASCKALATEIERLPDKDVDPGPIRSARMALLDWLAAPRAPEWTYQRIILVVMFILAGVTGIGAASLYGHPASALLLILFIGSGYMIFRHGPGHTERHDAREVFKKTGLDPPGQWDATEVKERLQALDRELVQAEDHNARYRRRDAANRELASIETNRLTPVRASLKSLANEVGFDPEFLDASFERWLRLVGNYDRARESYVKSHAQLDRVRRDEQEIYDELIGFLKQHNEIVETTSADAAQLAARVDRLANRVKKRDDARARLESITQTMTRLDNEIGRIDKQARNIFEQAGLAEGDDVALEQRLAQLDTWKQVRQSLHDAQVTEREREQDLGDRNDLKTRIEQDDEDYLQRQLKTYREQAEHKERIAERITRVEADIDRAGRDRALEEARTRHQAAGNVLRDRLDEALFAQAGHCLLDQVETEHQQASQPEALRRAAEWFRRFTRYQFELVFETEEDNQFAARETSSGQLRRLTELSSGTRMQLRLAVRIAFALEAERGREPLPLILDEALTTADPERFDAAAESLQLLAREDDRQIFYLTAQPGDARYWMRHEANINCIDLAAVRGQGQAITEPEMISPPSRPGPASPEGLSPEEYAIEIGVPPVDCWQDSTNIHLFWLLRDDLEFLYRLLSKGIERVGHATSFFESDAARHLLSGEERDKLNRRTKAAGAWLHAWREGRGRPVDRQALVESGAISDTFIDQVTALAERMDGDAKALIEQLESGKVDRFRTDKREQLAQWLEDHGYLDNREPMNESIITLRVAGTLQFCNDNAEKAYAEARLLTDSLSRGMAAGSP